jgi:8-hydroxy-5-deazaflavin:NADPH oxidoreductase
VARIGIVGAGHIGSNLAQLLVTAGHEVTVSFSTDARKLAGLAANLGAAVADPAVAAARADVVVLSVPWGVVDVALQATGDLTGKLVIDTTNQFGQVAGTYGVLDLGGLSGAATNAAKAPDALWVKAFNTLTSGFQASAAGRVGPDRVVMFYATDYDEVTGRVESLIDSIGFDPVRTGTLAHNDVGHQEPKGALYGEEYHHDDAVAAVARLQGTAPAGTGRP